MQYGYRINDTVLPKIAPAKEGCTLRWRGSATQSRNPVAVSLGPILRGISQPHVDLSHAETALAGVIKRVASRHPVPDPKVIKEFEKYVSDFLTKNLTPLPADTDVSVDTWLDNTNYPLKRRVELKQKFDEVIDRFDDKHVRVKCFVKDERYPDYKHARGIYSRTDEFKCFVGPYFKAIETEVYHLKQFIKHVPVAERPDYILNYLDKDGQTYATDYTAFESQFTNELMNICEFQLYRYMTKNLPTYHDFNKHLEAIAGEQKLEFKHFGFKMPTSRMSGEMCTSLGNGFSNLMFASFIADRKGHKDLKIVVEGDDGLFRSNKKFSSEDFAQLGLTIKIVAHDKIETASFCGLIFDSEERINVTSPLEVLADFGWGTREYLKSKKIKHDMLLRCKSLSLAHQYPGCPIINSLANYGIRNTRHVRDDQVSKYIKSGKMSMWDREQLLQVLPNLHKYRDERNLPKKVVGTRTRNMIEEIYGISIELQCKIEETLDNKADLSPLSFPILYDVVPRSWVDYDERFTVSQSLDDDWDFSYGTDGRDHLGELISLLGFEV